MSDRSSKKQQELLQFIDNFVKGNGYGPSYREIMRGLGYKSVSTVAVHVNNLVVKGYIRKKDNSPRSIEVMTLRAEQVVNSKDSQHHDWLRQQVEAKLAEVDAGDAEHLQRAMEILGLPGLETNKKGAQDQTTQPTN